MTTFIEEMKDIGQLSDMERALLAEMKSAIEAQVPQIVDAFYDHLQKFEVLDKLLKAEPDRVDKLRAHLSRWLVGLADGDYGTAYFEGRYRIGKRHVEVGLEPRYVIAAMAFCRGFASKLVIEAEYADDPQKQARLVALNRIMDLDLNIMLQSYDDHRLQQFLDVTGFSKVLFETLMAGG